MILKRFALLIIITLALSACGNFVVETATPATNSTVTTVAATTVLAATPTSQVVAFQYPTEKGGSNSTTATQSGGIAVVVDTPVGGNKAIPTATPISVAPTSTPVLKQPINTPTLVAVQPTTVPAAAYNSNSDNRLSIEVNAVAYPTDTGDGLFKPKAGNKFVALTLDFLVKPGATNVSANPFFIKAVGDNKQTYTLDAATFAVDNGLKATNLTDTIPEVTGVVVFQIPSNVTLATLIFEDFQSNIQIPLKFH